MPRKTLGFFPFVLVCFTGNLLAEEKGKEPTVRELRAALQQPLDMKIYSKPMDFKEALGRVHEKIQVNGKGLPIWADTDAFKEENPDAPDIYDTEIKYPPLPRFMAAHQVLEKMIRKFPTQNGTFLIKPGVIEITTQNRAKPECLLQQKVRCVFTRRPLNMVLEDLYDMTGVPVIMDGRVGQEARIPMTVKFTNEITLDKALVTLAGMANLKLVVGDEIIIITNPSLAKKMLRDQKPPPEIYQYQLFREPLLLRVPRPRKGK